MQSLDAFAAAKLSALDAENLRRILSPTRRLEGPWVVRGEKRYLSFSCNDYLNLALDYRVKYAATCAIEEYGTGAGASRLVTGDHPLMSKLEKRLSQVKATEAACVFSSGYMANVGTIPTFAGPGDLILADERSHACIWAGAKLSGAQVAAFNHNDVEHLNELLGQYRSEVRNVLVITEGVFSMDGDLAPIGAISAIARSHGAWLMTDDAHGIGVLADGRGSGALWPGAKIDLQMGTLSKALGSSGGYVCGAQSAIDLIKTRSRSFVYSTGLPPASAAAALAAIDIMAADPDLTAQPLAKARRFTRAANLPEAQSPIVPLILGDTRAALDAQAALEDQGYLVVAIRPPTVANGTARLRIAFSAAHPDDGVDGLAEAVRGLLAR